MSESADGRSAAEDEPSRLSLTLSGPIDWGAHSGELLEEAMALLLFQERKDAKRRRPSQGDGGVDVLNPVPGGYEVYQIKKFAKSFDWTQKRQIEDSLNTVMRDPRLDQPVVRWYLIAPHDMTSEEEVWFQNLTSGAPFPCDYRGALFWNSEAAKYSYVIDYMFRDGKSRLIEKMRSLGQLLENPELPIRPGDVVDKLSGLLVELQRDPHMQYDILLTRGDPPPFTPGALLRKSKSLTNGGHVTVDVYGKYPQALEDSPAEIKVALLLNEAALDQTFLEEHTAHTEYGRLVELPTGALAALDLSAPGGLGENVGTGDLTVTQRLVSGVPLHMELELQDDNGEAYGFARVNAASGTGGVKGVEYTGVDTSGALQVTVRIDEEVAGRREVGFNILLLPLTGLMAAGIRRPIKLMNNPFDRGVMLRIYGGEDLLLSVTGPKQTADFTPEVHSYLEYIEDLATLQRGISAPLTIQEEITSFEMAQAADAAALVRGDNMEVTELEMSVELPPEQLEALAEGLSVGTFHAEVPLWVIVAGSKLQYGVGVVTGSGNITTQATSPSGNSKAKIHLKSGSMYVKTAIPSGGV